MFHCEVQNRNYTAAPRHSPLYALSVTVAIEAIKFGTHHLLLTGTKSKCKIYDNFFMSLSIYTTNFCAKVYNMIIQYK